jgi:hypothetical protein
MEDTLRYLVEHSITKFVVFMQVRTCRDAMHVWVLVRCKGCIDACSRFACNTCAPLMAHSTMELLCNEHA